MACPSIVRTARPEDFDEVWRLLLQGHHENGQRRLAPEKAVWYVNRALFPHLIPDWDNGFRGAIGVIGDVGRLEGLVFVGISSMWYSHDRHIEEFIVYVDPECRKSFHARALIKWMKERVEKTKLPLLTGIISNERTAAKVALYERMLPKIGAFFFQQPENSVMLSSASCAA
jgi:GNAT superfamily N-acetyltransferase